MCVCVCVCILAEQHWFEQQFIHGSLYKKINTTAVLHDLSLVESMDLKPQVWRDDYKATGRFRWAAGSYSGVNCMYACIYIYIYGPPWKQVCAAGARAAPPACAIQGRGSSWLQACCLRGPRVSPSRSPTGRQGCSRQAWQAGGQPWAAVIITGEKENVGPDFS